LAVGARVSDPQGGEVGTVSRVEGGNVTLKLASGKVVRLDRSAVGGSANGAVTGTAAAELEAAPPRRRGSARRNGPRTRKGRA
jgi:hypothetical protein